MQESEDEWIEIVPKQKKNNYEKINHQSIYNPTFEELKTNIINAIKKFSPYAVFVYGSRARNTHSPNSDVDIMVFWSFSPSQSFLREVKSEILYNIKIQMDFVNMIYKKSKREFITSNEHDKCYYDNLINEAIYIYPPINKQVFLEDLLPYSKKLHKM